MPDGIYLATQFVNTTQSHIFLTGKAGTGKTTFLRDIARATHKNFVIVAPTGIAALNAEGVTIHSQFLFPFGSYLPEPVDFTVTPQANFFTRAQLARKHPLNLARKQVLRSLELLVIDEVSMLRADLLDAIDYRLRAAKSKYSTPFGGVQLLLIGDLFQLPPIVKEAEWDVLKQFYASPHFFESLALKKAGYTYIELDKVFRQSDEDFVQLLNKLRNNQLTASDLEKLNAHYAPTPDKTAITLTTHNRQADALNQEALDQLPGKAHRYEAKIEGDFPEHLYPLAEQLVLKTGARVMFTRNDAEGSRFYNGKIATVSALEKGRIEVLFDEEDEPLEVPRLEWKNQRYSINEKNKEIEEEVIGTYQHYPLKLAWAITVHKSQGLTFNKANLLVDRAFAPGQVYVALSRLRSLEGLCLSSPIAAHAVMSDGVIGAFADKQENTDLETRLSAEQHNYVKERCAQAFDLLQLLELLKQTIEKFDPKYPFEDPLLQNVLSGIYKQTVAQAAYVPKFMRQLDARLAEGEAVFSERLAKGVTHYVTFLEEELYRLLLFKLRLKSLSKTKAYVNAVEELEQLFVLKLSALQKLGHETQCLLAKKPIEKEESLAKALKEKYTALVQRAESQMEKEPLTVSSKTGKKKQVKGATYETTYQLIEAGKSLEEIARERSMALSTIEGHAARGVGEGRLKLEHFLSEETLAELEEAFATKGKGGLNVVYAHLNRKYTFGQLRIYQAGKRE